MITDVAVDLPGRAYTVRIGPGLMARAGAEIAPFLRRKRVFVLTDLTVAGLHLPAFSAACEAEGIVVEALALPPGEGTKCWAELERSVEWLLAQRVERDDIVVALGGGVIGDLAGFAASILRRGVRFVQVPTSLLAQVDSSVGGKTGINAPQGKNLIGAFYQPRFVLADISLLDSLPRREVLAGYAEVVKYGLLGDRNFFEWLESNGRKVIDGDAAARIHAVEQSVKTKARIVAQDEREGGVRALLNLGHTFGHALEAETGYGLHLNHGEAVAIGMIMAAELSARQGLLDRQDCGRIRAHFEAVGLPLRVPEIPGVAWKPEKILDHMRQDKKISGGKITLILMRGIGEAFSTQDIPEKDILALLEQELPG